MIRSQINSIRENKHFDFLKPKDFLHIRMLYLFFFSHMQRHAYSKYNMNILKIKLLNLILALAFYFLGGVTFHFPILRCSPSVPWGCFLWDEGDCWRPRTQLQESTYGIHTQDSNSVPCHLVYQEDTKLSLTKRDSYIWYHLIHPSGGFPMHSNASTQQEMHMIYM